MDRSSGGGGNGGDKIAVLLVGCSGVYRSLAMGGGGGVIAGDRSYNYT